MNTINFFLIRVISYFGRSFCHSASQRHSTNLAFLKGFSGIFKKSRICNTHNKHFYFTTFTYVEHPTLNSNLALTLLHAPCASRVFKWNAVLPSKVLYCFTAHCKNLAPQKWIWQQKAFLSMLCLSLGYFYFIRTNILLVNLN